MGSPKAVQQVNDWLLDSALLEEEGWVWVVFMSRRVLACRDYLPEIEGFAARWGPKVCCLWIDIDENPTISKVSRIQTAPTTLVFHTRILQARFEGPYSREYLDERFSEMTPPEKGKKPKKG